MTSLDTEFLPHQPLYTSQPASYLSWVEMDLPVRLGQQRILFSLPLFAKF